MVDNRDMEFVRRMADSLFDNARDSFHNAVLSMSRPTPLMLENDLLFCPACHKYYSGEHADQKPNFCENCGQAFDWSGEVIG